MKTEKNNMLKMQKQISVIIIVIGIALMIMQITLESEPGAIPLLLIISGSVWHFITRARIRSLQK